MNTIHAINGPVVKVAGAKDFSMLEMVYVGDKRLIGEVIGVNDRSTTIQVYENTAGLKIGEPVIPTGAPVCATLGPGIISNIFDGIERPLRDMIKFNGAFVAEGSSIPSLDEEREFDVTVTVKCGDKLTGGMIYCTCPETALITHKCMVPPNVNGTVTYTAENGMQTVYKIYVHRSEEKETEEPSELPEELPVVLPQSGMTPEVVDEELQLTIFHQYTVCEKPEELVLPDGYIETVLLLGEQNIPAYTKQGVPEEFLLLVLRNAEGETGWYQYDRVEQTLQRVYEEQFIIT
ncbi:MAG: hypothetical protein E7478_10795, partial [Ruminococcaceae bacterium]|nr:hypothetical protein [Oscillospiraceae bacterium]